MTKSNKNPGGWSASRRQLATWDRAGLLAIVRDLYGLSGANRDFIDARCRSGNRVGGILERYRDRIIDQFFPASGFGKLKLGEARRAIREYRTATGNLSGVAELMMTYVESATKFTREFGDIDERFYASAESVLIELASLLRGEAEEAYPLFHERLAKLENLAEGIGWGFGDFVEDTVAQLEAEFDGRLPQT